MSVRRVMTDLPGRAPAESQEFCRRVLGREPMIDLGWIVTLADPAWPGVQLSLIGHGESASVLPAVSVEVTISTPRTPLLRPRSPTGTGTSSTC